LFPYFNTGVKQKYFLSVDIIFYFCLTCTQTERFQKLAPAPNNGNVRGNYSPTFEPHNDIHVQTYMKYIITSTYLFIAFNLNAQTVDTATVVPELRTPCSDPTFPGLKEHIKNYLKTYGYPDSNSTSYVKVYVEFDVDTVGKISQIKIKRGADAKFNDAAIDIVKKMPNLTPKICNGKPMKTRLLLPITFRPE